MEEFVGRSAELETLEESLFRPGGSHRHAIMGLGGIGKSRLALEIAHRIKSTRPTCSVFWIQATDVSTFETDCRQIGKLLQIPGLEDDKADIKSLVKQHLSHESAGEWLLVLDSADDAQIWCRDAKRTTSTLSEYLPRSRAGSILVTTRTRVVATSIAGKNVMELQRMEKDKALQMLQDLLLNPEILDDVDATSKLLEELTFLPLAIVQAAAFINRNDETIENYLRLLDDSEENVIRLLSEDFEVDGRYTDTKNPIASTWLVSFDQIQRQNKLAADYLSFISCLSPKNIPESLFPDAPSAIDMSKAIGLLKAYSFLTKLKEVTGPDPLYDMHRLVHLSTRNWLKMRESLLNCTQTVIGRLCKLFPTREHENKDKWILYMPHAQYLCASALSEDFNERYALLEKLGLCLVIDGKYEEAVRMHSSVVLWREKELGNMNESTLEAYDNLGEALRVQGHWVEAEKYSRKALDGRRAKLGVEHPDTLTSMANLASTYRNQGRWKEAEELEVQVIETRKRVLGQEHLNTLTSMGNLASTFWNQGRWKETEVLFVQVMETRKKVLGQEHPDTLTSMGNLASTYRNQGRWKEAEELEVQVMETRKRVLGQEHPDTLTSMANLASTYRNQGRWKEAEELEVQVIETRKRVLGQEHPDTLTSMGNLASTFWNQGRWEAEELEVQVMETRKRVLGQEHPDTLTSMNNLAFTLKSQGRDEALELITKCVQLSTQKLGANHPNTKARIRTLKMWTQE
jgi:tetratricopeptide (TPR) repeat protein